MEIKETYDHWFHAIASQGWVAYSALILFLTLAITYGARILYKRLLPKLAEGKHYILSALLDALYSPLIVYLWVQAITAITKAFDTHTHSPFADLIDKIREVGVAILLIWLFIRFIRLFEEQLLLGRVTKKKPDRNTVSATGRLLRIFALMAGILVILPVLGIPISGIVAFGGGSAVVVGIAAQQILANYFGGMLIFSDRHFKVGDWIHSPDRQIEGTVEHIGWRSTCIRTFDKRPLYVPNAVFTSIVVINAQRMSNRRIKQEIGIRYEDGAKLDGIITDLRKMLKEHPEIDQTKTCMVHFLNFGPSALSVEMYTFTKTTDWEKYRDVQQEIFLTSMEIIEKHGAQIAYPTTTLHVKQPLLPEDE